MKKDNKSKKKTKKKIPERKNLSIVNQGDLVIIRNRSTIAAAVIGVILLGVCAAGVFTLRDAWDLPMFWLLFGVLIAGVMYSVVKAMLNKVVLDSPEMTITVYNPAPITYKFEDVNYIDVNTAKATDGAVAYIVTAYIGVGKRTVEIISYSKEQADELASLLRGMLDNGSMVFPEGNEEPFNLDEKGKHVEFTFITRKKKDAPTESAEPVAEPAPQAAKEETDKESEK